MIPDEEKTHKDKLEEEIAELMNRIKNTEYDLMNMFKGNAFLQKKLENSQKALAEKKALLEQIKASPKSSEELDKIEKSMESDENISKEQEGLISKIIEEEL